VLHLPEPAIAARNEYQQIKGYIVVILGSHLYGHGLKRAGLKRRWYRPPRPSTSTGTLAAADGSCGFGERGAAPVAHAVSAAGAARRQGDRPGGTAISSTWHWRAGGMLSRRRADGGGTQGDLRAPGGLGQQASERRRQSATTTTAPCGDPRSSLPGLPAWAARWSIWRRA